MLSPIERTPFGQADGKDVELYTLTNANGLVMKVMTYGAAITHLWLRDRKGARADVVLGFDDLAGYLKANPYFGVTVGRVANRIRNATFTLEGKSYQVAGNDHGHHLHGGVKGWDKVVWSAAPMLSPEGPGLRLRHTSPDGEEGYPGNVTAEVTYTLTNDDHLKIVMHAVTDRTTLLNMAQHSYFNLAGESAGSVADHELHLHAAAYTPGDPMVPTGEVKDVKGTPFDFTAPKPVGRDLKAVGGDPIGYDHNFVVDASPATMRPVAWLKDPASGRVMRLSANQPGVQLYTGNFLDGTAIGKGSRPYRQYAGLCLETQGFPNAINVPAWRDQVILTPGHTYRHEMEFEFTAE